MLTATTISVLCLFFTNFPLLANALDCFQCESLLNSDCIDLDGLAATKCSNESVSKCFVMNANGAITRGCFDESNSNCQQKEDNCKFCSDNGCNSNSICKYCTADDPQCSQTDVLDRKFNRICQTGDSKCLVYLRQKRVERRCATAEDKCSDTTVCNICSGANCNALIFPANRRRCYQCSGSQCNFVVSNGIDSTPCVNYEQNENCYTIGHNFSTIKRGCQSDAEENSCPNNKNKDCLACNNDNCNNFPYERYQMLRCIQCSSDNEDFTCFEEHSVEEAKNCENKIIYSDPELCYTLVKDGQIKRGCLHDDPSVVNDCNNPSYHCVICNDTHGCNHARETSPFTCIVCRSDLNKKCWNDADKLKGEKCRNAQNSDTDQLCFHGLWNNIAIRGCLCDADERMSVTCQDANDNQCHVCEGKDCNVFDSSGSGSLSQHFTLLIFVIKVFIHSQRFSQ